MIKALPNKVLVKNLEQGERTTTGGIVLRDDNGKSEGIRSRWCEVYSVGEGVQDLVQGEWILVSHGRWTRGINIDGEVLYLVDYPNGVLLASSSKPVHENHSEFVTYRPALSKD